MLNKAGIIERCVRRIREEFEANPDLDNFTHQDALILNVERACQACIDLGMHVCASRRLGIPQQSADVFRALARADIISGDLAERMARMTGFRNCAVHMYQVLDPSVIHEIATVRHHDFLDFAKALNLRVEA